MSNSINHRYNVADPNQLALRYRDTGGIDTFQRYTQPDKPKLEPVPPRGIRAEIDSFDYAYPDGNKGKTKVVDGYTVPVYQSDRSKGKSKGMNVGAVPVHKPEVKYPRKPVPQSATIDWEPAPGCHIPGRALAGLELPYRREHRAPEFKPKSILKQPKPLTINTDTSAISYRNKPLPPTPRSVLDHSSKGSPLPASPSPRSARPRKGSFASVFSSSNRASSRRGSEIGGSRRGSITQSLKTCNEIIFGMSEEKRQDYVRGREKAWERKVEEARRVDPMLRPPYQCEAIIIDDPMKRDSGIGYGHGHHSPARDATMQAYAQEANFVKEHNRKQLERYEHAYRKAQRNNTSPPTKPVFLDEKPSRIDSDERKRLLDKVMQSSPMGAEIEPLPYPGLPTEQRIALRVGRLVDKVLHRTNSDASDMEFGMTDVAPAGTMARCEKCQHYPRAHLKAGLCEVCHAVAGK